MFYLSPIIVDGWHISNFWKWRGIGGVHGFHHPLEKNAIPHQAPSGVNATIVKPFKLMRIVLVGMIDFGRVNGDENRIIFVHSLCVVVDGLCNFLWDKIECKFLKYLCTFLYHTNAQILCALDKPFSPVECHGNTWVFDNKRGFRIQLLTTPKKS